MYQTVFKRYEIKYMLTAAQKEQMLRIMAPYMEPDQYGPTTIRNIYFDTDNYRLIRRSLERPAYKEKLRIRSYRQVDSDSKVFVELKKKYQSVVYKRRLSLQEAAGMGWICGQSSVPLHTQIAREIEYFRTFYEGLRPAIFLTYDREAFYAKQGHDFRITFDDHILCRQQDVSLRCPVWGNPLLEEGKVLMEIKCSGGIPLWLTHALTRERVYKTSFSKYGRAYETMIYPKIKEMFFNNGNDFSRTV